MEIVRGVYDAFARRDNAAPFAAYALDIELDFRAGGIDAPSLYHGHDGVKVTRHVAYLQRDLALADLGLEE